MKRNRSNKFTTGLCNTFRDNGYKVLFFELDKMDMMYFDRVIAVYENEGVDFMYHRTGGGGMHFLSPSLMTKERYKLVTDLLEDVNTACPMTTLRIEPNKHPFEEEKWYRFEQVKFDNKGRNSKEMSSYLNKIFGTSFSGDVETELIIVRYPLPL